MSDKKRVYVGVDTYAYISNGVVYLETKDGRPIHIRPFDKDVLERIEKLEEVANVRHEKEDE